ncbi:cytochrome P450 family 2 subfamily A member 6 gene 3 L homeolog isoform X1 [Xenopus laevis]|uniref:Cytochrome P450 family 2 subfamily A member 6 gene 3 L homeolog isoform X1 n=1 Tax=Xenopus laevis TaxID=8355 RepID=A0A8J1LEQ6_XENLA|nr:cytochrome P450 family 2 subfamily A member 6 gene 3 L homeolog isoform X1 [Xenopus laevis]
MAWVLRPEPEAWGENVTLQSYRTYVYAWKHTKRLGSQYGPVSMVFLGQNPVLVLNGYDVVKEAFVENGEVFSNRGKNTFIEMLFKGRGVAFSNGETWRQMRRFSLSTLRDFGMGKRSIEERVQEEACSLVEEFNKTKGAPFDSTYLLTLAVSNVICSIVFGNRFEYKNETFLSVLALLKDTFRIVTSPWTQFFGFAPGFLQHFPGPHKMAAKNIGRLKKFVTEIVTTHEETLDENSPRDYIDCFLIKMRQEKGNVNTEFDYENLFVTLLNLFFAGTETTSITLRYGMLLLLKYPDIQKKIHDEIDCVVGLNRCPSMEDRPKLPYTDATIHEIQRFADIVPMGVPRSTNKDTTLRGYDIPKGTTVFPMLTSIMKDPRYFKDPESFNPCHFLDEKGSLKKSDAFLPFSIGKRVCLGEGLARMEIFLFLTSILQRFELKCHMDPEDIDISPVPFKAASTPRPYELYITPR